MSVKTEELKCTTLFYAREALNMLLSYLFSLWKGIIDQSADKL